MYLKGARSSIANMLSIICDSVNQFSVFISQISFFFCRCDDYSPFLWHLLLSMVTFSKVEKQISNREMMISQVEFKWNQLNLVKLAQSFAQGDTMLSMMHHGDSYLVNCSHPFLLTDLVQWNILRYCVLKKFFSAKKCFMYCTVLVYNT